MLRTRHILNLTSNAEWKRVRQAERASSKDARYLDSEGRQEKRNIFPSYQTIDKRNLAPISGRSFCSMTNDRQCPYTAGRQVFPVEPALLYKAYACGEAKHVTVKKSILCNVRIFCCNKNIMKYGFPSQHTGSEGRPVEREGKGKRKGGSGSISATTLGSLTLPEI